MRLSPGTYKRIALEQGCSPSLVAKVAAGTRRNLRIELAIEKERLSQLRSRQRLLHLRSLIKKTQKI